MSCTHSNNYWEEEGWPGYNSKVQWKKVSRQRPRSAMPWKTLEKSGLEPVAPTRLADSNNYSVACFIRYGKLLSSWVPSQDSETAWISLYLSCHMRKESSGFCQKWNLVIKANRKFYLTKCKNKTLQIPSFPREVIFVSSHTLRMTPGRVFACPFLENQLSSLLWCDGSFLYALSKKKKGEWRHFLLYMLITSKWFKPK